MIHSCSMCRQCSALLSNVQHRTGHVNTRITNLLCLKLIMISSVQESRQAALAGGAVYSNWAVGKLLSQHRLSCQPGLPSNLAAALLFNPLRSGLQAKCSIFSMILPFSGRKRGHPPLLGNSYYKLQISLDHSVYFTPLRPQSILFIMIFTV